MLQVRTLTTVDALEAIEREWLALLGRNETDLPFLRPEWVISWWEIFRQDRSFLRDSLQVKEVRAADGALLAVVPLMLTERPAVGPLRVRSLSFVGADHYITEQRCPVALPGWGHAAAAAVASDLLADDSWSWISWEGLQPDGEWARGLGEVMALQWTDSQPGNVLDLLPSWDEFRSSLKRNIKESLRHCYNSLRREGLTLELAVASAEPELGPALETFFRLHTARSGQANGVNHPDRFADPRARRFLSEVCRRLAQRDGVRVFTLHLNGRPVASRVGFVLPGCLYLYYSGFDPEWARFSVATTLVSEAIRYAIGAGLPRVHLSMGADTSKSRWGPRMPRFHAAVTVRARAQARAVHGLYSWSRSRADRLRPVGAWIGRRQG